MPKHVKPKIQPAKTKLPSWTKKRDLDAETKKLMVDVSRPCGNPKHKKMIAAQRAKWGVSYCDTYSLSSSLPAIMANALFAYSCHAGRRIVLEGKTAKEEIMLHAQAIREWGKVDHWDGMQPTKRMDPSYGRKLAVRHKKYMVKEKKWREAMAWLTENIGGLWW